MYVWALSSTLHALIQYLTCSYTQLNLEFITIYSSAESNFLVVANEKFTRVIFFRFNNTVRDL